MIWRRGGRAFYLEASNVHLCLPFTIAIILTVNLFAIAAGLSVLWMGAGFNYYTKYSRDAVAEARKGK